MVIPEVVDGFLNLLVILSLAEEGSWQDDADRDGGLGLEGWQTPLGGRVVRGCFAARGRLRSQSNY